MSSVTDLERPFPASSKPSRLCAGAILCRGYHCCQSGVAIARRARFTRGVERAERGESSNAAATELTTNEAEAIITIALVAALANGRTASDEREQIRSLFDSLAVDNSMPVLSVLHQRVILRQASVQTEAARLLSESSRRMGFAIAVCVVDADGAIDILDLLDFLQAFDQGC